MFMDHCLIIVHIFLLLFCLLPPVLEYMQLTINLRKEDSDPEKIQSNAYFYAGGLVEYVRWLNTDKVWLTVSFVLSMVPFYSFLTFWT